MTELSARHRVLFVNHQYTLKDLVTGLKGRRFIPVRQLTGLASPLVKKTVDSGHDVFVWTPPLMLPVNWLPDASYDRFVSLNVNRFVNGLRRVMRELSIKKPLVINAFNPAIGFHLLGKLDECATVYYCFDEISVERWTSRHGSRYEPLYLQRVDAVITTSEALRQSKSVLQPNTFCVKNGVNFELFNKAQRLAQRQLNKQPMIGYLGTADDRIDLDLVEYCVRALPGVTFQFVGEVNTPQIRQRLANYANVSFVPPHQPADLPPLLAQMSVAMIPYVCNAHTYTIYPLKINEYLAAGLPVVSTPFSILDDFDGIITLANTPEAFAQALQRALAESSPAQTAQRIAIAQANSWSRRAHEFETIIDSVLKPAGDVSLPDAHPR